MARGSKRTHHELEERTTVDPRARALAKHRPRNDRELYGYFKHILGLNLATRPVVEGHDAPFDFFKDVFFKISPSVMGIANRGGGKCAAEGELLTLADGRRVAHRDLVGTVFTVPTLNDQGQLVTADACAEWNETEQVYCLTTESGYQVIRNAQHPLWAGSYAPSPVGASPVLTSRGWQALGELAVGDVVAVTEELSVFGTQELPDHEVKLLAYLIGDGGMTADTLTFTQMDGPQLDEVRACAAEMDAELNPTSNPYGYNIRRRSAGPAHVRDMLRRHGLMGKHSRDKRVPEAIFSLTAEQVALFLSRLFATDGWAALGKEDSRGKGSRSAEIGFCSVSEGLVRDVQALLQRFGIHSRVFRKPRVNAWVLVIKHAREIVRFAERIGIYGKEDAVSRVVAHALPRVDANRGSWRRKNAHPGTRWEKVVSIVPAGVQRTVAVTVKDYHTYAHQLFEHNSFGSAALHTLNMVTKPGIDIVNVAAIKKQAEGLYNYIAQGFALMPVFQGEFAEIIQTRTRTVGGSNLAILPGTMAGVSGPHPNMTLFDEVEFVDWAVLQQGISMAQAKNGYPAQNVYISTRQRIYGSMNRLSENARKMGIREYRWAVWESMEKCPLPDPNNRDRIDFNGACKRCPLMESCWSDAEQHKGVPRGKRATGFMSYEDIAQRREQMTDQQWDVQMECKKPSKRGLVYTEFDEALHVDRNFDTPLPDEYTPVFLMGDWGFNPDPAVVLLGYSPRPGYMHVFKEFVFMEMTEDEVAHEVALWCREYQLRVTQGVVDASAPAFVKALNKRLGPIVIPSPDKSIENGIQAVRKMLKPRKYTGRLAVPESYVEQPRLTFRPRHKLANGEFDPSDPYGCAMIFDEFNQYHWPDSKLKDPIDIKVTKRGEVPVDSFNHTLDALRYYVMAYFGPEYAGNTNANAYLYTRAVTLN
ncbi:hypothetical protein IHN63_00300 [Deinococcus sp. 6YEL10]|uniref:LAGLIDADG family homing endonuclease n=1 Tax=Deinococcus sp. 6YEL10 TaxID=2745870 RepID=UPI001E324F28|nr:LAGLIDADG family homing endonuclease [Deinococcus sp. 6YEL10]MCD0159739.1 hypothetical protein [Deinococcus sp. 6YEL10]